MVHRSTNKTNGVKPWILVLGIVAVVGLDLAFTSLIKESASNLAVYTPSKGASDINTLPPTAGDDSVEPAVTNDEMIAGPPVSRRPSGAKNLNVPDRPRNFVKSAPPAEIEMRKVRVTTASLTRQQSSAEPSKTNRAASYPYAGSTYFVKVSDGLEARAINVPRDKKDSFASKALPLVKKPWQWMKALASKFK